MPIKYTHCIDCGAEKTTYSQQLSPRCNACSGKHKRTAHEEYYTHCVDCGEPRPPSKRQYPRCRQCAWDHNRKHEFFDTCQECGESKKRTRNKLCPSCSSKRMWEDDDYREKMSEVLAEAWSDEERREWLRQKAIAQWEDPEIRERNINGMREAWEGNDERRELISGLISQHMEESGRKFRTLYDHCQECGQPKPETDRELCLSCAGVKRMTELYGGDTDREYPYGWSRTLKKRIRERDSRRCVLCGKTKKENGRKLDVHHIDYDKSNLDPSNLVSLCQSCHGKTNWNHSYWQQVFTKYRGRQPKQDWQRKVVVM